MPAPDLFSHASPHGSALTRSVTVPSDRGAALPADYRCECGAAGIFSDNWFLSRPDRASWHCAECFEARRNKKQNAL